MSDERNQLNYPLGEGWVQPHEYWEVECHRFLGIPLNCDNVDHAIKPPVTRPQAWRDPISHLNQPTKTLMLSKLRVMMCKKRPWEPVTARRAVGQPVFLLIGRRKSVELRPSTDISSGSLSRAQCVPSQDGYFGLVSYAAENLTFLNSNMLKFISCPEPGSSWRNEEHFKTEGTNENGLSLRES